MNQEQARLLVDESIDTYLMSCGLSRDQISMLDYSIIDEELNNLVQEGKDK